MVGDFSFIKILQIRFSLIKEYILLMKNLFNLNKTYRFVAAFKTLSIARLFSRSLYFTIF